MELSDAVRYIIDKLGQSGYRADVVGGAVRDHLIGRPSFDYDMTTEATPEEVKCVFSDERIIDTGIKHGTVTLMLDGVGYEITTWRRDGDYLDNRHPESVSFTRSLEEDLVRRDFTVNAIAYNPCDGFTDLYGGLADIEAGILRAVGDPVRRFTEDALRIIRGIRFAAELGFIIEESTERAMRECLPLIKNVSAERIFAELKKLLSGRYAYEVITKYFDMISSIIPELASFDYPDRAMFDSASARERFISLFVLMSDEPTADFISATERLRTDALLRRHGEAVIRAYKEMPISNRYDALRLLNRYGADVAKSLVCVVGIANGENRSLNALLSDAFESEIPYTVQALKINGKDILSMGVKGARVGEVLSELLDMAMREEIKNDPASMLAQAQKMCRN